MRGFVCRGAIALSVGVQSASAALQATATITGTPIAGGYNYTITLNNTGTTTVGTLWYAWIPGQNYMPVVPTNITSPAGWSASVVGGAGAASILWQASSSASYLGVGNTLSTFSFNSTMTPAQMAANAPAFPGTPIPTSFVYSGAAFSDAGYRFVGTVVPSPTAASLLLLPIAVGRRRR